jgi:peptidyl-prolyl cis-trans isomerase C
MRGGALAALAWIALAGSGMAIAQAGPDDPVLTSNGTVKVYRSEYDAELLKMPPDIRPGFANSKRRINELLTRLLVQKSLAAQPETAELARTAQNQVRIRLEAERVLAQLRVEDIETRAGRAFDARRSQYEARARELYLANRARYATPEQVSASHILFDAKKHSRDEGRRLAEAARARIVAGADFNAVATEVSEDPSAGQNAGKLGWFSKSEMDPAFANAAFALSRPGDISEPVLSSFGWHLIKLEDRRPPVQRSFDEVRDLLMAELRRHYIDEQRESAIAAVRDDPAITINHAAVDALYLPPARDPAGSGPRAPARDERAAPNATPNAATGDAEAGTPSAAPPARAPAAGNPAGRALGTPPAGMPGAPAPK